MKYNTKTNKPVRNSKSTRTSKPIRISKPDWNSEPARNSKPTRTSKPGWNSEPARNSKPTRTSNPKRISKPDWNCEPERNSKPTRTSNPKRISKPDWNSEPTRNIKPSRTNPKRISKPDWNSEPTRNFKPSRTNPKRISKPDWNSEPTRNFKPSKTNPKRISKPDWNSEPTRNFKPSKTNPKRISKPDWNSEPVRNSKPTRNAKPIRSTKPIRASRPTSTTKPARPRLKIVTGKNELKLESNEAVRLNKFLADSGIASRRKADELIAKGSVKVNGKIVTELGIKVTYSDFIAVDGEPVKSETHLIYILLNKPKDYITTTKDEKGRKTVLDIVKKKERIFPVGRLDRNSTGALLLTNDGDIAYRLTHPKFEIPKEYHASLDKKLTESHAKTISKGIDLDGEMTAPCELFINPEDHTQVILILKEGKNREVRKIFEALGYEVMKLDRKYFAGISTKGLSRGEYRHLTHREVLSLKKLVKL